MSKSMNSSSSTFQKSVKKSSNPEDVTSPTSSRMHTSQLARLGNQSMTQGELQSISFLALIEQRCKTQAAEIFGLPESHPKVTQLAPKLFKEMAAKLEKAGLIPNEMATTPELEPVRAQYMNYFDDTLRTMAIQHAGPSALGRPISHSNYPLTLNFPSLSLSGDRSSKLSNSTYSKEYRQICLLGKGGFGSVYRALNHLEDREYAIKKIVITAERLHALNEQNRVEKLFSEVRALAKLGHPNIVRYHHTWIEFVPASMRQIEEMGQSSSYIYRSSSGDQTNSSVVEPGIEDLRLDAERDLLEGSQMAYQPAATSSMDYSDIFEREGTEEANMSRQVSVSTQPSKATEALILSPPRAEPIDPSISSADEEVSRSDPGGFDAVIYIKMGLYPMTLEDYIWPDQQSDAQINHCFHTLPAACILLAILNGVEYIHKQRLVHRDLKPSNVFLSVHRGTSSASGEVINTANCKDCDNGDVERVSLTPYIGDFGLVAKLDEIPGPENEGQPTSIALLASTDTHQPGTRFYHPASWRTVDPKLDVYSLGVIAFELVYKFGTKSERSIVLEKVGGGVFPVDFKGHELEEGIKKMLCNSTKERWSCTEVRAWLQDIITRYETEAILD
ncbi:kinase-like domain-containing protein [Calycina marina]|uniref:non-specific serine/threonine protein kinase n=1 Tax=Calycina marina TaxID=1763456 RepID=A0A9P7Z9F4_9HELO|nr:kinase-like domain-containing protein [Calycina marina]